MAEKEVRQPRTLKLKHSSYQPSKAEVEEEFSIEASPEEIARAMLSPTKIVYEKPKRKGWFRRRAK